MQVNDHTPASWRVAKSVAGRDADNGGAIPVVVGLRETAAGGVQVALRVGDGLTVNLTLHDAGQLEVNVREVLAERFRMTIGTLGGEQP